MYNAVCPSVCLSYQPPSWLPNQPEKQADIGLTMENFVLWKLQRSKKLSKELIICHIFAVEWEKEVEI